MTSDEQRALEFHPGYTGDPPDWRERNLAAIQLLRQWSEEDQDSDDPTWPLIEKALYEDRYGSQSDDHELAAPA